MVPRLRDRLRRRVAHVLGGLGIVLAALICLPEPPVTAQQVPPRELLVVRGDADFPPYESLVDGKPVGANVELWEALGRVMQRRIDLRLGPWAEAQQLVLRGDGHALTFLNINEERRQLYDFTQPTFTFRFPVFVRAGVLADFNTQNLLGKRIAVKRDGFPVSILATSRPEAIPVEVDSVVEGFRMLLRGEVDGVVESEWVGNDLLRQHGFTGIRPTPVVLATRTAHIAVPKGDPGLVAELNRAILVLNESGELDRIADRWAGGDFVLWRRPEVQIATAAGLAGVLAVIGALSVFYALRMRRANRLLRHEIAQRKAMQAQLNQAQKMEAIGRLAGGIAHDFNNILGAVVGYAQFISEDTPQGSDVRLYAGRILTAAERAKQLIQQLLAFSRRTDFQPQVCRVLSIVEETAALLRPVLPVTTALEIDNRAGDAAALADPTQLSQVLINICMNANDAFEGRQGRIRVTIERRDSGIGPDSDGVAELPDGFIRHIASRLRPGIECVAVAVSDTGPGMTRNVVARLFEPFFTTKPKGKGTGLGLPVVHGIVLAHDGALVVTTKPGVGATFEVQLPAATAGAVTAAAPALAAGGRKPEGGRRRILIVDDDIDFGDMAAIALERLGYEVAVCHDSGEALAAFQENPKLWHLVVTDQVMLGLSGIELIAALRATRPDIPCILCSGYSENVSDETARRAGADAFLPKPVDMLAFSAAVTALLRVAASPASASSRAAG